MDLVNLLYCRNSSQMMKIYCLSEPDSQKFKSRFDLNNLSDTECKDYFRFSRDQIKQLRVLLKLPSLIKSEHFECYGTEALCIVLRRMSYPNRLVDLKKMFYRSKGNLSLIFNHTMDLILQNFEHLLSEVDQWWLTTEYLKLYSDAVFDKGAPLKNCWGFIDGTVRPICRPTKFQRECFNGHHRVHALKFQSVVAANGLIANLFGPIEGRRHDAFMLAESNLLTKLQEKNNERGTMFCVYGDPAYPLRVELQGPFKGSKLSPQQSLYNKKMSMTRIAVEWVFGRILNLWAFLDYKKNHRLYLQPVGKYFKLAALLTNIHTCYNGNQVSIFFNLEPPTAAEYLI